MPAALQDEWQRDWDARAWKRAEGLRNLRSASPWWRRCSLGENINDFRPDMLHD